MSNTFGRLFRIHTFGESHGRAVGVVVDGCPAGLRLDVAFIQHELDRRRPGQSKIVTRRDEPDRIEILSGEYEGHTTGAPICMLVFNQDHRPKDYEHLKTAYRPSHADYTYQVKYGLRDHRGGGRASARETLARVAGGAVAKLLLKQTTGIEVLAWVASVGDIAMPADFTAFGLDAVEATPVRCPHPDTAAQMIALIEAVRKDGDTIGGVVGCRIRNVPPGLGEPVFNKLHADLGSAMLGINACKGFEYGSGFAGTHMRGSAHNDLFYTDAGKVRTRTNHSGGIQGGISNGAEIDFRAAFKPVATILRPQPSIDEHGNTIMVQGKGRHDPCVLPRAVPIVEAMAALVLADHYLLGKTAKV
jgi:chorismate synthase